MTDWGTCLTYLDTVSVCEIVISLTGLADLFLTSKYSCAYSFLLDVVSGPENKITTF